MAKKDTTTTTKKTVEKKVVEKKTAEKKTAAPKQTKSSSKKTEVVEPVVAAPAPVEAVKTENVVLEDVQSTIVSQSNEFFGKLQQLGFMISSLKNEYRTMEKKWTKELKASQKLSAKRKSKQGARAPSGFVKPTAISQELAGFLNKPFGTEMARTEVTKDINSYIIANNLQNKDNGRIIEADAKLSALLKLKKNEELTYFNLQRYMSPHFAKAKDKQSTSSA